jgi:aerobic-type carbon monoxide dehydrogenase small subunit (CoxS/CutS family)
MAASYELTVNGAKRRVEGDPKRSLLSALRNDLGLTGAKYGCGEGQCGACTVLLDGRAVRSCVTTLESAAGRAITTIEGLAPPDGKLHPLQEAFLAEGAFQCGFCTPGMILAGVPLCGRDAAPGDEEIVRALDGNLCRCGNHPRIVAAVRRATQSGGPK